MSEAPTGPLVRLGTGGTFGRSGTGGDSPITGGTGGGGAGAGGVTGTGGAAPSGPPVCSDVLAPTLQTYAVEISAANLSAMTAEFLKVGMLTPSAFAQYQPLYYPIVFHWGSETVSDAFIRLKGQSSWEQAVQIDGANGKMQFVLVFDHVNSSATFHGVSKITLDMPRTDTTFMHDRLANNWMRYIGVPALCATSARLEMNGSYYGLYVAEEHIGHHFLTEFFPGNANGDLFKGAVVPETNSSSYNKTRLAAFWAAMDPAAMAAIVDIPASLSEWAAEAMLNDGDGYWGGGHNYYIYDQGAKGYVWTPDDLYSTFDWLGNFTGDPIFWWSTRHGALPAQHYMIVMNDPNLRKQYVAAVADQLARWDVAKLQGWVDDWSKQVRDAAGADPHKPASTTLKTFDAAVAKVRQGVSDRATFVKSWLACKQGGTGATDKDGDGFVWCEDCRDDSASVHPGAPEICGNGVDDNCNGEVDEAGCK